MTKAYETTPGTMPHRAVEFLRKSGATCLGREVSTAVICDFLGTDAATLHRSMGPAKDHGIVRARRLVGRGATFWWCLGEHREVAVFRAALMSDDSLVLKDARLVLDEQQLAAVKRLAGVPA